MPHTMPSPLGPPREIISQMTNKLVRPSLHHEGGGVSYSSNHGLDLLSSIGEVGLTQGLVLPIDPCKEVVYLSSLGLDSLLLVDTIGKVSEVQASEVPTRMVAKV